VNCCIVKRIYRPKGSVCYGELGQRLKERAGSEAPGIIFTEASSDLPPSLNALRASEAALKDPAFWKSQQLDAAIFTQDILDSSVLLAAKTAGVRRLGFLDTDGILTLRAARASWLKWFKLHLHWNADGRFGVLSGLRAYADFWFQRRRNADGYRLSFELLDKIVVQGPAILRNLKDDLCDGLRRPQLIAKTEIIPFPVRPVFTSGSIPEKVENQILCAGRLLESYKNPKLLFRCIQRFLEDNPSWKATLLIVSKRESVTCQRLAGRFGGRLNVKYNVPSESVRQCMNQSKILFSSSGSFGETFPIIALEAFCAGNSLVARNLPGFIDVMNVGSGAGTLYTNDKTALDALEAEVNKWNSGMRSSPVIARLARGICSTDTVAQEFERVIAELYAGR